MHALIQDNAISQLMEDLMEMECQFINMNFYIIMIMYQMLNMKSLNLNASMIIHQMHAKVLEKLSIKTFKIL